MPSNYKTPGVYVEEVSVFPPSVAPVATAIPAFIGYTDIAIKNGEPIKNVPTKIGSFVEFQEYFGGAPERDVIIRVDGQNQFLKSETQPAVKRFYLFDSLRLFYDNGGGDCYIVSVGTHEENKVELGDDQKGILGGLKKLEKYDEPTIILSPDAVLLEDDGMYTYQQQALKHCSNLQDRFFVGDLLKSDENNFDDSVNEIRDKIGINSLNYGALYAPYLRTNISVNLKFRDVKFARNEDNTDTMISLAILNGMTKDENILSLISGLSESIETVDKIKEQTNLDVELQKLIDEFNTFILGFTSTDPISDWTKIKEDSKIIAIYSKLFEVITSIKNAYDILPTSNEFRLKGEIDSLVSENSLDKTIIDLLTHQRQLLDASNPDVELFSVQSFSDFQNLFKINGDPNQSSGVSSNLAIIANYDDAASGDDPVKAQTELAANAIKSNYEQVIDLYKEITSGSFIESANKYDTNINDFIPADPADMEADWTVMETTGVKGLYTELFEILNRIKTIYDGLADGDKVGVDTFILDNELAQAITDLLTHQRQLLEASNPDVVLFPLQSFTDIKPLFKIDGDVVSILSNEEIKEAYNNITGNNSTKEKTQLAATAAKEASKSFLDLLKITFEAKFKKLIDAYNTEINSFVPADPADMNADWTAMETIRVKDLYTEVFEILNGIKTIYDGLAEEEFKEHIDTFILDNELTQAITDLLTHQRQLLEASDPNVELFPLQSFTDIQPLFKIDGDANITSFVPSNTAIVAAYNAVGGGTEPIKAQTELAATAAKEAGNQFIELFNNILSSAITYETTFESSLKNAFGTYKSLLDRADQDLMVLPPSAAIAGVYTRVDNERGVWKAPANVSLNSVSGPYVTISANDQENLNVDVNAGKSINAIRSFTGKGVLVWGARTLAGNDNEWRYVSVRRFFIFAEESIKKATEQFVFEPNDANTWVRVRAMIENFLTLQWRDGALAGAKPSQAFFVKVGLGETMTPIDILEGRMIVEIGMAVVRPAEFIILRFSHKMQEA